MKLNKTILALCGLALMAACQNEVKEEDKSVSELSKTDIITTEAAVDTNVERSIDTLSKTITKEKAVIKEPTKKKRIKKQKETKIVTNKKEENKKSKTIKTSKDLGNIMDEEVNRQANPDNSNGIAEIKSDSDIKLIPVFTDADKAKYYVQVIVKVHKMSKSELSKVFSDSQKVYIVNYQGLYKYCVGQFNTEKEAKAYKTKTDKKYGFKGSQVVTYKEAW